MNKPLADAIMANAPCDEPPDTPAWVILVGALGVLVLLELLLFYGVTLVCTR